MVQLIHDLEESVGFTGSDTAEQHDMLAENALRQPDACPLTIAALAGKVHRTRLIRQFRDNVLKAVAVDDFTLRVTAAL